MATYKQIHDFLKENGYTEEQMNEFWNDALEVNWKVRALSEQGKKNWSDLDMILIEQIPECAEKTRAQIAEREAAEKAAAEAKANEEAEAARKATMTREELRDEEVRKLIEKVDAGEFLSERELSYLVYEGEQVDEIEGDDGRWSRMMTTVIECDGRCFAIEWQRGLTEMQENIFMDQPYEVSKKERKVVQVVTEWIPAA